MDCSDHLFRRESGRMVAALTRTFGIRHLRLAEDAVQEAFCRAIEVWRVKGIPENPSAWLMSVARNCALDVLRRERTARDACLEVRLHMHSQDNALPAIDHVFSPTEIDDGMLRMMFSCCHHRLREPAQVALILNILCGFSVDEVASAFVSTHAATEKQITRAKKLICQTKTLFDITQPRDFSARLPAVQRAVYLLFNEGYHGASAGAAVRTELCREAMRLAALLLSHPLGGKPSTYALSALMCLVGARLPARIDGSGNLHALLEQDRSQWDQELLSEGARLLELSASGDEVTDYHLEAAIALVHASAKESGGTNWDRIIDLYDLLIEMRPSPIVALNRAIALAQRDGPDRGLRELEALPNRERLSRYPFYFAALGEFELRLGRRNRARRRFDEALALVRNSVERRFLQERSSACEVASESKPNG